MMSSNRNISTLIVIEASVSLMVVVGMVAIVSSHNVKRDGLRMTANIHYFFALEHKARKYYFSILWTVFNPVSFGFFSICPRCSLEIHVRCNETYDNAKPVVASKFLHFTKILLV